MTHLARIKRRRDFLAAAKGRKKPMPGLVLQSCTNPHLSGQDIIRFGLTASKRVGNAVIRNRVRRRLRALAYAILPQYGQKGFDYVLIGRAATFSRPHAALVKDLEIALQRIHDTPRKPYRQRKQTDKGKTNNSKNKGKDNV